MGVKLKSLSGRELVSIFEQFGFGAISQNGSHVKMRRMSDRRIGDAYRSISQ
jgi:predicted RNA binding protein YcfA (HicA-like mRNA interferase family)